MIDFNFDISSGAQPRYYIMYILVYFIVLLSKHNSINSIYIPHKKTTYGDIILLIAVVFTSIVAFTRGDFFSYAEIVRFDFNTEHIEDFYRWLIDFVNHNYLLWRIVVWGGALLLLLITIKRLQLDVGFTFLVFFLGYIQVFNYARVSLACAVYFWGLSFLIKPLRSKILSYIIAASSIWCCQYFHTSVYALMGITVFLFVPLNKRTIPILLLVAVIFMRASYSLFLNYMSFSDETYAEKFMQYEEYSERGFLAGISGFLTNVLEYGSILVPFIIVTKNVYYKNEIVTTSIKGLQRILFGIVFVALTFVFMADTIVYFYRILNMAIIPLSIMISYLYTNAIMSNKELKICVYWFVANQLFFNLYSVYLQLL